MTLASKIGSEFQRVRAMRPAEIVGPLKPVLDVEIGVAAAPTAEFRRARLLPGINKRKAREPQLGSGKHRDVVLLGKADALLPGAEDTAVMTHVAEPELIH